MVDSVYRSPRLRRAPWVFGVLACVAAMSCKSRAPNIPDESTARDYAILFPELLRDPDHDVRDLLVDAFRDLDRRLGTGVISAHKLDQPMQCWVGQRSIPHDACTEEAQRVLSAFGGDGLVWGYALNVQNRAFLAYLAPRGATTSYELAARPLGQYLTERDVLRWFSELLVIRLEGLARNKARVLLLRERLEASANKQPKARPPKAKPEEAQERLLRADMALLAAELSWLFGRDSIASNPAEQAREVRRALANYSLAQSLYSGGGDTSLERAALLGQGSAELWLAEHGQKVRPYRETLRSLVAAGRSSASAQQALARAAEGRLRLLLGREHSDQAQLEQAVTVLESLLSDTKRSALIERGPSARDLCTAAHVTAKLAPQRTEPMLATCRKAIDAARAAACASRAEAEAHVLLAELYRLSDQRAPTVAKLTEAAMALGCARAQSRLSGGERQKATQQLASTLAELGYRQRSAEKLKEAAALYRTLLEQGERVHRPLGVTLARLAELEPAKTTLEEAVAEFVLADQAGEPELGDDERGVRARAEQALALLTSPGPAEPGIRIEGEKEPKP